MTGKTPHSHQRLGGKVGPRIAVVVSKTMGDHFKRTAHDRAKLHAEGLNEFFRQMGVEKSQHISPFMELYLGHEDTPAEVEKLLRFMHSGKGEASEVLNMLGVGQAVGTSILSALSNYLAPINQKLIQALPNALLDPGTAASAYVRGLMSPPFAEGDAAKAGIDSARFNVLRELAEQFPGVGELLTLWRRGFIDEGAFRGALHRQGIHSTYWDALENLKVEVLPPADLALAVLRGHMSNAEGAAAAIHSGVYGKEFDILVKNTGEPPGLMQLLEAYRRGFIDLQRLDLGIKQSRVRDEWSDVIQKLRYVPASTSDAARGVVQHHLSEAEGKQIAEWNGLRPEDWGWLIKTVGNPPGAMETMALYNRGVISKEGAEQALRESHLKDEYIPHLFQLRVKIPPVFQLVKMIERGTMSAARGAQLLKDGGYPADVAESLVKSATHGNAAKEKQLAAGEIRTLYHNHAIDRAAALTHLEALGYHKGNAELLLVVTDLQRESTLQTAAAAPIKSSYIAHRITEAEASADLDKLRIPAAQRDYMLELWTIDRTTRKRTLTEAQIVKANEKGLFTDEVAISRLEGLGYDNEDARIILDLEKHRTRPV